MRELRSESGGNTVLMLLPWIPNHLVAWHQSPRALRGEVLLFPINIIEFIKIEGYCFWIPGYLSTGRFFFQQIRSHRSSPAVSNFFGLITCKCLARWSQCGFGDGRRPR